MSELFRLDPGLNSFRAGFAVGGFECGFEVVPAVPAGLVDLVEPVVPVGLVEPVVPLNGLAEAAVLVVVALLVGGVTVPPSLAC